MECQSKTEKLKQQAEEAVDAFTYKPSTNLKREFVRLLFEISARDNTSPEEICALADVKDKNTAHKFKKELLSKRFKNSSYDEANRGAYLPQVKHDEAIRLKQENCIFKPRKVFCEKGVKSFPLYEKVRKMFPEAELISIDSFRQHLNERGRGVSPAEYNRRRETLFLIKERFDFYKVCPCTNEALRCGYFIFNLGFGCPYECSYCYLQHYQDHPGIILSVNPQDYLKQFDDFYAKRRRKGMRIGTGEFTDSLVFDHITEYSSALVEFFKTRDVRFELKTKSANVDNLLKIKPAQNIVISWSLNPSHMVESDEKLTAPLLQRLNAAKMCAQHGYSLAFHFDPIFVYDGWEKDYEQLVEQLFSAVGGARMSWISLGTLRFNKDLKTIAEQRFPQSRIYLGELLTGVDQKMRYPRKIREDVYRKMLGWIKKHDKDAWVYLCMEDKDMWEKVYGK